MVNGILLLYYQPLVATAPTILEHVEALSRDSQYAVWPVNTARGFPSGLTDLRFRIIVLHYSLFGPPPLIGSWPPGLNGRFRHHLTQSSQSYKIAFFQDEHHFCQPRFAFLTQYAIDCVYTLLHPNYWDEVYRRHSSVRTLKCTLTGYVSDELVTCARSLARPDSERGVDVGYRARRLPFYMGRGGQEKSHIAEEFIRRRRADLVVDVDVEEGGRIYGDAWWRFLANCRGVLGVEAGVSIFDIEDRVRVECTKLLRAEPLLTFEEAHTKLLHKYEGNITYRTISPRHFEAAAFRVCQILFEGDYQGILQPGVHYLPLKKDFSDFDQTMAAFLNPDVRRNLTDNAYRDLIASGRWSYRAFVADFDRELQSQGLSPEISAADRESVSTQLKKGDLLLRIQGRIAASRHARFPGRQKITSVARRLLGR